MHKPTKSYWSYNHPLSSWSDIEDRYQRSLIDRKIETRKRLFSALKVFTPWYLPSQFNAPD